MTDVPFEVLPFSSANLFRSLGNERCDADEVAAQDRSHYLYRYLSTMGTMTIVVENHYTDGDYLEDFASYYVRCHAHYNRHCKRLHFFSQDLAEEVLRQFIRGSGSAEQNTRIRDSYIGFVVARPLPNAIIGRTILKTYPPDNDRRHYPVVREYRTHFFGTPLSVLSLPFQEQDRVLAACATVALWCAFHKTAEMFGTPSPRPAIITGAASRGTRRGRPIPSHGLSIEEMCEAVRNVGLEPEIVECTNKAVPLVSLVYGHLMMGLPVILIVDIQSQGPHAITLTGFSLREERVRKQEVPDGQTCIPMIGLRIDEFYGHDDQIGPFSRISVAPSAGPYPVLFHGDWKDRTSGTALDLRPTAVLIPVYNKIRVTFLDVQVWLTRLNSVLASIVPEPTLTIEWDVRLTTTNEYKTAIRRSLLIDTDKDRLLLKPQARFIWRALLRVSQVEALELLFDATDMERSFPICDVIWPHAGVKAALESILTAPAAQPSLIDTLTRRFLQFLKSNL